MVTFTYEDYCKYRHVLFCTVHEKKVQYSYNSVKDAHDKMYRDFLNDKREIAIFLKQFLAIEIEEDELINYNNTFITENYKNRHSDIVYKIKDKPIYFFVEHQSSIDNSINYRMLEYYHCILERVTELKKLKNKNYKFPIIIPILLYTGNKKWDFVPNVRDKQIKIVSYDKLSNKLDFEYDFININDYDKNELLAKDSMVSYAMTIDKCNKNEEVFEVLNKLANLINDVTRRKYIKRLVIHIFKDCLEESARNKIIEKINKGDDVNMKCSWDYIIEDFMKQKQKIAEDAKKVGKQEGMKEGKKAGFLEGMSNLIKKMLENGESIEKIKLYSGLSVKEIKEIEKQLKIVV